MARPAPLPLAGRAGEASTTSVSRVAGRALAQLDFPGLAVDLLAGETDWSVRAKRSAPVHATRRGLDFPAGRLPPFAFAGFGCELSL